MPRIDGGMCMGGVLLCVFGVFIGAGLSSVYWLWRGAQRGREPSDIIERVAKSICAVQDPGGDWRNYTDHAKAAVHAWNEAIEKALKP